MKRPKYQAYIQSPEWERVRKRILKRARGKCEKCQKRPPIQVHHLTYDRLGNERDEDLLAVCGPCHQSCHPDKKFWEPLPCFIGSRECSMCPSETALIFVGDFQVCYICIGCGDMEVRLKAGRVRQLRNRRRRQDRQEPFRKGPTLAEQRAAKNQRRRQSKQERKEAKRRRAARKLA